MEDKRNSYLASKGKEMTSKEFKDWIKKAESRPTISLQEALNKWKNKRKYLAK